MLDILLYFCHNGKGGKRECYVNKPLLARQGLASKKQKTGLCHHR